MSRINSNYNHHMKWGKLLRSRRAALDHGGGGAYHRAIRRLPPTFQPISGRGGGVGLGGGLGPAEGEGGTQTPTYMA